MKSLKSHEGWLSLDNRAAGGGLKELATYTCSHCQVVAVVNPDRTRERYTCTKCNHRICDQCKAIQVAAGGACKPFKQLIDEVQEMADKGLPVSIILL